mmetsp:Transcript_17005/g.52198  ORF Transcript_17005/g.52198 Transcript_17005/m.52198 type:complete len:670 (+) Transcript_17005:451-2460(+)
MARPQPRHRREEEEGRRGGRPGDDEGAHRQRLGRHQAGGDGGHHGPQRLRQDDAAGRPRAARGIRHAVGPRARERRRAQHRVLPPQRELRGPGGHAHGRLHRARDAHVQRALHAAHDALARGEGGARRGRHAQLRPRGRRRRHRRQPLPQGPQRRAEAAPEHGGGDHPQAVRDPARRAHLGPRRYERHGHRARAAHVLQRGPHRGHDHPPAVVAALGALRQVPAAHARPLRLLRRRAQGHRALLRHRAPRAAVHEPRGPLHPPDQRRLPQERQRRGRAEHQEYGGAGRVGLSRLRRGQGQGPGARRRGRARRRRHRRAQPQREAHAQRRAPRVPRALPAQPAEQRAQPGHLLRAPRDVRDALPHAGPRVRRRRRPQQARGHPVPREPAVVHVELPHLHERRRAALLHRGSRGVPPREGQRLVRRGPVRDRQRRHGAAGHLPHRAAELRRAHPARRDAGLRQVPLHPLPRALLERGHDDAHRGARAPLRHRHRHRRRHVRLLHALPGRAARARRHPGVLHLGLLHRAAHLRLPRDAAQRGERGRRVRLAHLAHRRVPAQVLWLRGQRLLGGLRRRHRLRPALPHHRLHRAEPREGVEEVEARARRERAQQQQQRGVPRSSREEERTERSASLAWSFPALSQLNTTQQKQGSASMSRLSTLCGVNVISVKG